MSRILGRFTISVPGLDLQALGPRAHGSETDGWGSDGRMDEGETSWYVKKDHVQVVG